MKRIKPTGSGKPSWMPDKTGPLACASEVAWPGAQIVDPKSVLYTPDELWQMLKEVSNTPEIIKARLDAHYWSAHNEVFHYIESRIEELRGYVMRKFPNYGRGV